MGITIRKANTNDFPAIFSLFKEFSHFQKTPEKVLITVDELIEDENFFECLVAEAEHKKVIGFATFFFAYYSWTGRA
ncbi:MAG: GNAT family N-acetyltransferase, partial [Ginsengibacter sp.]